MPWTLMITRDWERERERLIGDWQDFLTWRILREISIDYFFLAFSLSLSFPAIAAAAAHLVVIHSIRLLPLLFSLLPVFVFVRTLTCNSVLDMIITKPDLQFHKFKNQIITSIWKNQFLSLEISWAPGNCKTIFSGKGKQNPSLLFSLTNLNNVWCV